MKYLRKADDVIITEEEMRRAWKSEMDSGNALAETFEQFLKWLDASEYIRIE